MKKAGLLLIFMYSLHGYAQQSLKKNYQSASVEWKNNILTVTTGAFERRWKLTSYGLVTTGIKNLKTGKQWATAPAATCDWAYSGLLDASSTCKLVSIKGIQSNDEGFTSEHLLIEAEFEYPAVETFVKYEIRAYPQAPGLYTRLAFKGNAARYSKQVVVQKGVTCKLITGKGKYDYQMHGYTEDYIANYVTGSPKVEYLIEGLNKSRQYKVGISWWDFEGAGRQQSVTLSSVDGENTHQAIPPTLLPDFKHHKQQPQELVFDVPAAMLSDGSFRLFVNQLAGSEARISELWILENSQKNYTLSSDVDRVAALRKQVPAGWTLAGYENCGPPKTEEIQVATGRVDFLPVKATNLTRRYAGYYNDTQHRNKRETPLLKEEVLTQPVSDRESIAWASVLMLEDKADVLTLVKESHKCVNQYGYDTGAFELSDAGIASTGTSLSPKEILPDRYRSAWASWVIASGSSADERELALKRFERLRFPVNPKTDVYMIANTWGSDRADTATDETNILLEMKIQQYLGIDVQQIDAGYQTAPKGKSGNNAPAKGWYPHPGRYPEGFKNVRAIASEYNMRLGLWFPAMQVTLEEMKNNYDAGGFAFYKLDFANIRNHTHIEQMLTKIRAYETYTHHLSKVNWDVTENAPRFGYFWAKEYGNVFLENRKPKYPENVVYTPYLVLRDLWHLSRYCNLNKFQGSVQNKDAVDKEASDAYKHTHRYTAAIPLMATPLFFQETHFYSQQAQDEIKNVLSAYKQVRNEIYESYVYPIGDEPSNASWTGFQAYHPEKKEGYLTLFREIENTETGKKIQLHFLKNQNVRFTNLLTNETFTARADKEGFVSFEIGQNGDFRMLKYAY